MSPACKYQLKHRMLLNPHESHAINASESMSKGTMNDNKIRWNYMRKSLI